MSVIAALLKRYYPTLDTRIGLVFEALPYDRWFADFKDRVRRENAERIAHMFALANEALVRYGDDAEIRRRVRHIIAGPTDHFNEMIGSGLSTLRNHALIGGHTDLAKWIGQRINELERAQEPSSAPHEYKAYDR